MKHRYYGFFCLAHLFLLCLPLRAQLLDTTFNAYAKGGGGGVKIQTIALQKDGKIVVATQRPIDFANGSIYLRNLARLNADGSLDESFDSGTGVSGQVMALDFQSDGKIIVGGSFTSYNGTPVNYLARLNVNGSLDPTFTPGSGFDLPVSAVKVLPNDKIVVGGSFTAYQGIAHKHIVRLNGDGTPDAGFSAGTGPDRPVRKIELSGPQLVVSGNFTSFGGLARKHVARLREDGTVDATFDPGSGPTGFISGIRVYDTGKVLVFGDFSAFNGKAANSLMRLNPDGSIDNGFVVSPGVSSLVDMAALDAAGNILLGGYLRFSDLQPLGPHTFLRLTKDGLPDGEFNSRLGDGPFGSIEHIAVQPDGRILIASAILNDYGRSNEINSIARLLPDGLLDASFKHPLAPKGRIFKAITQPDGKILVAGMFNRINHLNTVNVCRLHADGTVDPSFRAVVMRHATASRFSETKTDHVNDLILQPDGKILVAGAFTSVNGLDYKHLVRLNPDGTVDTSFETGTGVHNSRSSIVYVQTLLLQPDGKILFSGAFDFYDGISVRDIVRLNPDGSLDPAFSAQIEGITGGIETGRASIIAFDQSGKLVVVAGNKSVNDKIAGHRSLRLHSDGKTDATFTAGSLNTNDPLESIKAVGFQSDGKLIIGGAFSTFNGQPSPNLLRLHTDGSVDTTFRASLPQRSTVVALGIRGDTILLVNEEFVPGKSTRLVVFRQFAPNGALIKSRTLNAPSERAAIHAMALRNNGEMVLGGEFTSLEGQTKMSLAKYLPFREPAGLVARATGPNRVQLTWVDQTDLEAGFEVQRSLQSGGGFSTLYATGRNQTTCLDTAVAAGVTYYYRVRAVQVSDSTAFSAEAEAAPVKIAQTIDFEPIADKLAGDAPFALLATASSGLPVSFRVVSGPAAVENDRLTILGAGKVTITASQEGNGGYAAAVPVERSFCVRPAKPTIAIGADNTLVSSSPTGNQWLLNGTPIAGATAQSYIARQVGSSYTYSVLVTAEGPCTNTSDGVTVTAIEKGAKASALAVYPNPARDGLRVQYTAAHAGEVKVYVVNLVGVQVATSRMRRENAGWQATLDVSTLPPGQYILVVVDGNGSVARSVTKQ